MPPQLLITALPCCQLIYVCLSLQFDFNVDSIDDVEEDIIDDIAEEDDPVTAEGAAAATASDFDKELAEFENAFD